MRKFSPLFEKVEISARYTAYTYLRIFNNQNDFVFCFVWKSEHKTQKFVVGKLLTFQRQSCRSRTVRPSVRQQDSVEKIKRSEKRRKTLVGQILLFRPEYIITR
jgi:hypothetical protein